ELLRAHHHVPARAAPLSAAQPVFAARLLTPGPDRLPLHSRPAQDYSPRATRFLEECVFCLRGKTMPAISNYYFRTAILFLLAGIAVGIQMSISQVHNVTGAHAHINLLGWV